jgi:lipopolysaccharide export system protein LptA
MRFLLLLLLFPFFAAVAQTGSRQIELLNANSLQYDERLGNNAKRLLGDVRFRHEGVLMYCDSAYYYDNNKLDAFGHVLLVQGDTLTLQGELMHYDGNEKKADIEKNVVMNEKKLTLTTRRLLYDIHSGIAHYPEKGKIVSEENTLTSETGYYYSRDKMMHFRRQVVLVNPDYTIKTDTMKQHTVTEVSYFLGPTHITGSKGESIYCENGWYNSRTDEARFGKNSVLNNKSQTISGDSLYYNKQKGYGYARNHVMIHDTSEKLILSGQFAELFEKEDYSYITGEALMRQYDATDTLFLHADTLKSTYDSVYFQEKKTFEKKQKTPKVSSRKKKEQAPPSEPFRNDSLADRHRLILAWHGVRFYKKDMQGVCDSLSYGGSDSLMKMYVKPVLWNEKNQLTGDHIRVKFSNGKMYYLDLLNNCFIGSMMDSMRYNQIKGKKIRGIFTDNELHDIRVRGNAESIYYARDDEDSSYIGINRAVSKDMFIKMKKNKVEKISFLDAPDATMHPIKGSRPEDFMIRGFTWFSGRRPISRSDIFRKELQPLVPSGSPAKEEKEKTKNSTTR